MNVDDQRITQNKLSVREGSQSDQGCGVGRRYWKEMIKPKKYFWWSEWEKWLKKTIQNFNILEKFKVKFLILFYIYDAKLR